MSGNLRANAQDMDALSNQIDGAQNEIRQMISKLERVREEVQAAWAGRGGSAYQTLQSQANRDLTALNKLLGEIREAVKDTAADFTAGDEHQESELKKLQRVAHDDAITNAFG